MNVNEFLDLRHNVDAIGRTFRMAFKDRCTIYEWQILSYVGTNGSLNLKQISQLRFVSQQGIGRICKRLHKLGLVDIRSNQRDQRQKVVTLSPKGKKLVAEITDDLSESNFIQQMRVKKIGSP